VTTEIITLPAEVVTQTNEVEARAAGIIIICEEQYLEAADFLGEVDKTAKRIDALRVSLTKPLDESKKRIMDLFRGPLDRLAQAKQATKDSMLVFRREQQEAARIAAAAAETERLRLIAEAEAKKQAEIEEAMDAGEIFRAESLAQIVPLPPPPVVVAAPVAACGIAVRKLWRFRVVAPDLVPRAYLQIDERLLADLATSMKGEASVPGVEFYYEESIARTGR
jgi:hypothetical protein